LIGGVLKLVELFQGCFLLGENFFVGRLDLLDLLDCGP
jgi:hypothetical protein